ncbi:RDD family protein [Viridibacillus sp. FSL R5-0477]|uniref:RDD domain-containing protein n=1 Tax=Viridibacillus arenosi FSL R5-213 TaxID=1227360 RepID=W4F3E0_9BACL|nr:MULTISPECIES: RDD family protein [Viridibacillus]ETT87290.1 RDD domain-containing protein [Viridibacillus arenosi FSL R5-213]OMC80115.1 RDD family protein [Viridibacillus sp. FSL H8-0123]OMC87885.1 RDD family protein [Viridibacillus sp. FSL H7-0596]OMC91436.1 RDD family protein [Viridibacillus arenosi]
MNYGGFWIRFLASIIDAAVVAVATALIGGVLKVPKGVISEMIFGDELYLTTYPLYSWILIIVGILYFIGLPATPWRGTVGKKVLGIEIVDKNGDTISIFRSVIRNVARIFSGLLLGLGYIIAAFHPQKRALHDLVANTYVIDARKIDK